MKTHTYIHTTNIIHTEQAIFIYLGTHTHIHSHMCVTMINEKEAIGLKENKKKSMWDVLKEEIRGK